MRKNKQLSIPTEISFDENIVENEVDIASVFNEYFSSSGPQFLNAFDYRNFVALGDVDFSLSFNCLTSVEVKKVINSSPTNFPFGLDDKPTALLKY